MYLSTLFLSIIDGAKACEQEEDEAVMEALELCNHSFLTRWSDGDYHSKSGEKVPGEKVPGEKVSGEKVLEELRDFYDCVREFDVVIPFPLRVFVKKALLDVGKKEWADELRGMYEEEGVL